MQPYLPNASNLSDESELVQAIFSQNMDDIKRLAYSNSAVKQIDSEKRTPLHAAAYVGNVQIMEKLIHEGAEVNAKDARWLTPLHRACAKGNYEAVLLLLNNQADVNVRDKLWQSPLHVAAANNSIQCADYLLPHLNNLNFSDRGGRTALHHAALNGHLEMVKVLLKRGANIGAYDRQDRRALHWAAWGGETEIIQTLVANRADINCKDKVNGDTPAHAAAANGQTLAMKTFLELGFQVDTENAKKNTCLHIACNNGHDEIVQLLLNAGAEVNKKNKYNCTPLHYAANSSHGTLCLELLINKHADPNVQDNMGHTPLHLTAMHGRFGRAETLLSFDARIDMLDNNGNTALHLAARHGQEMLVTSLLNAGADPFNKGANGRLPIHFAALYANVNSCRKLLASAVNEAENMSQLEVISICDDDGRSSMHHAACSGSLACVEVFLAYLDQPNLLVALDKEGRMPLHYVMGAANGDCAKRLLGAALQYDSYHMYINVTDKDGRSPLHHAAAADENGTCVELLIERGADVTLTDNSGVSALHYAAAGGHDAVVKLLVDADNNILTSSHLPEQGVPSPLHLAAYYGHVNVVNILACDITDLEVASLDVADSKGRSPLELAAFQSNTSCAKTLINYGASPAQKNIYNNSTPLHSAACCGHLKMMKVIIEGMGEFEKDYDGLSKFINAKDGNKCTPLMHCVTNGHIHCVDYLLAQNASLWPVDKFGCTVMHRGAVSNLDDILHSLLRHADAEGFTNNTLDGTSLSSTFSNIFNAKSYNGRTALHFAAIRGNSSILESLLLLTNEVNVIDRYGYTPLHYACLEGHDACVEALLNHDSFYEFNGSTFSPLHCAVYHDNESCADRLLEIMGDDIVNLKDRRGRTPLHICALNDNIDCTRFLLVHNAETDATDYKSRTPLMVAIYKGSTRVFEELLKQNPSYSITDYKLNNALHIACIGEDVQSGLQLLENITTDKAVLDAQNDRGQTPLHLAARNGLTDIVTKLVELGCSIDIYDDEGLTPALACAPSADVADCLDLIISTMLSYVKESSRSSGGSSLIARSLIRESFDSYRNNRRSSAQPPRRLSSMYFSSSPDSNTNNVLSSSAATSKTLPITSSALKETDSDSETY